MQGLGWVPRELASPWGDASSFGGVEREAKGWGGKWGGVGGERELEGRGGEVEDWRGRRIGGEGSLARAQGWRGRRRGGDGGAVEREEASI